MATQTQTVRRPVVQAERVHDYLYDTHYVVSGERDHARATFKAHTGTDRVKRVPNFVTMFSELRHHPRFGMRLDVTDPVPKFINRQWRGHQEQAREALVRYTTFNYDPSVQVPGKPYQPTHVSGQDRYKFFRRPIIPFLQQVPPSVLLASARQDPLALVGGADQIDDRPPTPLTRTMMTQTDYRDSEAQTDPYTPEYVVRPGSQPELLTLATLSYGRGLPAGLAEVEMIERARSKRQWEATLPPLNDISQSEKRRHMMDEMERNEWALREREIEKLQEARLEVLKNLLKQREEHHQELNTKRLDRLWSKKQAEKEAKVKKIRNEHIKAIRKLSKKRKQVEVKVEQRQVVNDYSNFGSQVYAPLTRIGVFLDRGSEQFVVKSQYLNTYQGLLELEHSLPMFVTQPRIKAPKPKTVNKSGFTKRKYRQERELRELHEVIKENKDRVKEPLQPPRFLQKIEKPQPRPPTPAVEVPSQEEEERELATIFLQQVVRGRAIQNMMFEGKEKRKELIHELRSTHALQTPEQQLKKQEKQATLALQRQRRLHDHKESLMDETLSQLEGSSLGDMLDFLSKELIRVQEERRIHAFSMLAERQRRVREAEESGARQVEERRRREEDEIFKQVVKVHQTSVDTYLQDIIMASVDKTADLQARREIQELADKINDVAYDMERKRTPLESEEIVSELVHSFLLPEVQKETMREKVKNQQRKYLYAAHQDIYKTGKEIIDMYPKAPTVPAETGKPRTPEGGAGSRAGTPGSRKASRTNTPDGKAGSRGPTPPSGAGSRVNSPEFIAGSRVNTPVGGAGSRVHTPEGSVRSNAHTPEADRGSKPQTPDGAPGSKPQTPDGAPGSKPQTPDGAPRSKPQTPDGSPRSKPQTPDGTPRSKPQTPDGSPRSKAQTPDGSPRSKAQTPDGSPRSKAQTPDGSPRSKAQTPDGSPRSKAQTPDGAPGSKAKTPSPTASPKRSPTPEQRQGSPAQPDDQHAPQDVHTDATWADVEADAQEEAEPADQA